VSGESESGQDAGVVTTTLVAWRGVAEDMAVTPSVWCSGRRLHQGPA
jgi:hypothetical protein